MWKSATREGGKLHADARAVGIDVELAARDAKGADAAAGGHEIVDRAHQGLLEIKAAARCQFLDLGAQKIVVPGRGCIVVGWEGGLVHPHLDGERQPLRVADLEGMKADVDIERKAFEHDLARAGRKVIRDEPVEAGEAVHLRGSRNWTSRGSERKRWPPSRVMV